jgi:hypothetical protein
MGSGNIYGVANPGLTPVSAIPSADVTLTAGSEVTVITSGALAAFAPGEYCPVIHVVLAVLLGATAPTALQFAFKIGSGSDVDTYVVEPGLLVALAEFTLTIFLLGVPDPAAWIGAGSTINVTDKATTTACTVKKVGSRALFGLSRTV